MKRIVIQPVVRRAEHITQPTRSTLSKRPVDLFALWRECEFGCGGSKPAKEFSAKERGAVKCTYSLRLTFWKTIDALTRRGHTSGSAIDVVYAVYGRSTPVTAILRAMRDDKQRGGHPSLR